MNVVQLVMTRAGYTVLEANAAEQAKRLGELNPNISLLIADVAPPCSGVAVSRQLKTAIPALGIILMSGWPPSMWSDQDAALFAELAPDAVRLLPKPFVAAELLRIVADLIAQ